MNSQVKTHMSAPPTPLSLSLQCTFEESHDDMHKFRHVYSWRFKRWHLRAGSMFVYIIHSFFVRERSIGWGGEFWINWSFKTKDHLVNRFSSSLYCHLQLQQCIFNTHSTHEFSNQIYLLRTLQRNNILRMGKWK